MLSVIGGIWTFSQPLSWSFDGEDARFQSASELLNKGLYLEALGTYQDIAGTSKQPASRSRALLFIADTYSLYLNQYETALKIYQSIIRHYPGSPSAEDALFNTGTVLAEQRRYDQAHKVFLDFMKKYPRSMRKKSAEVWSYSAKLKADAGEPRRKTSVQVEIPDSRIRVLISENADNITFGSCGHMTVSAPSSGNVILTGKGPFVFSRSGNQMTVNGKLLRIQHCRIQSSDDILELNSARYHGYFTVYTTERGLCAVNHVPLEHYLYGVIPKEIPFSWEAEALKAQAVASRTYVLYVKNKSAQKPYDVTATTASQVFGGLDSEYPSTNAAVDATRGQVMLYDGRLIIAYFHSDSGGITEDAENVWSAEIPYLKGVPDIYLQDSDSRTWSCFISYAEIRQKLKSQGLNIGDITGITANKTSTSGRVISVSILTDERAMELTGNNFRIYMDPTRLKSALFDMVPAKTGVLFKGRGYGHGVGMSQWGARQMAAAGLNYMDILKHYYRNIRLVKIQFHETSNETTSISPSS